MVKIITDTLSSLPEALAQRYHIPIIPQVVCFGNASFLEGVEIDSATFLERLKTAPELPKTAAPPPELFVQTFKRLLSSGESIMCIHPSAEISGTVRSATVAAADFPDADIRVIDTRVIAGGLYTMVQLAAEWAAAGEDADAIQARLRDLTARNRTYFLVDTLEFLAKGGRIGGAAALLGSLLHIKPILTLRDGKVDQFERERTRKAALARLKALVLEQIPRDRDGYLTVMHAGALQRGQALADDLSAQLGLSDVPLLDLPPAVVTHAGPGVLAVSFFVKAAQQCDSV